MARKKQPQSGNGVYKITLTAVYNRNDIEPDELADGVFTAMTKVGNGLSLLHVDSVRKVAKGDEVIAKILGEVSKQKQDAMSRKKTDDGDSFVVVSEN